ncbi:MAG: hypothetical protein ACE5EZ_04350 [Thermodesulfobacteriota bacterium]
MIGRLKKYLPFVSLLLLLTIHAGIAMADFREIPLNKTDPDDKAHGYITIEHIGFVPMDRLLHVRVYSLLPNTLYDIWIVDRDTGKRTPAGFPGENTFKTNGGGAGHFKEHTTEFVLGWNKLEVSRHRSSKRKAVDTNNTSVILWAWMYQ